MYESFFYLLIEMSMSFVLNILIFIKHFVTVVVHDYLKS